MSSVIPIDQLIVGAKYTLVPRRAGMGRNLTGTFVRHYYNPGPMASHAEFNNISGEMSAMTVITLPDSKYIFMGESAANRRQAAINAHARALDARVGRPVNRNVYAGLLTTSGGSRKTRKSSRNNKRKMSRRRR